jgi:hypothetical protein
MAPLCSRPPALPIAMHKETKTVDVVRLTELDDHESCLSAYETPAHNLLNLPLQLLVSARTAFHLVKRVAEAMGS